MIELIWSPQSVADVEEIRAYIGADALFYQDVDAMKRIVLALNPELDGFEASCFDGEYITKDISAADLAAVAQQRGSEDDEDQHQRSGLNLQGRTR